MRQHQGEHPRFGALDVCPLVPIAAISMDETVEYARKLARRLGEEVGLTVYCYENAALSTQRRNTQTVAFSAWTRWTEQSSPVRNGPLPYP